MFLEQLKSEGASSARSGLEDEFGTNINGDGQDDMASDVQEGAQSTVGSLLHRNGVVRPPSDPLLSTHIETFRRSSMSNLGRMMNLVLITSLMDRHLVTLVHYPPTALLARSVSDYHGILLCD